MLLKPHHIYGMLFSAGMLLCRPVSADWFPELEQANTYFTPTQGFRIYLPPEMPNEVLPTLVLELDNIDVTAMVSYQGNYAVFTPVTPLQYGKHVLRLVEYADDGGINEKAYWEIDVRQSSLFRELDYAADMNLTGSYRVADNSETLAGAAEPDAFNAQGGVALQARMADDGWEINGQMELQYNSDASLSATGDAVEMASFLLTGDAGGSQLRLGHHTITQSSLILDGLNRRGVSVSTGLSSLNSAATGFIMRANEIVGFRNGLGVSDENNRISGFIWESQPITSDPQSLYLSLSLVNGKKDLNSVNTFEQTSAEESAAWALVADSTLLDQQLRLRGEFAGANVYIITADPGDEDIVNEDGGAVALSLNWNPLVEGDSQFYWNTGVEYRRVDTFFFSMGNPGLPPDKQLMRLYFNADWNGVSSQLSTARETDNVDGLDDRPTIETTLSQLAVNYAFNEAPEPGGWIDWLGIPSLGWVFAVSDQQQIEAASTGGFEDLDITTTQQSFNASFTKDTWNWGLVLSDASQENAIDSTQNQQTRSLGLNASFQLDERLVLSPSVQRDVTQIDADNSESTSLLFNLGGQFYVTDTLSGNITLNQFNSESDSLSAPQDSVTRSMTMEFLWSWIEASNARPGFDWSLSASWQDVDDRLDDANDTSNYQILLNLVMRLPVSSVE